MDYEHNNLMKEGLFGDSNDSSSEPRMKLGACLGILLVREDPFKVIPKRKDHNAH
mgnify:CR=1 FL=1